MIVGFPPYPRDASLTIEQAKILALRKFIEEFGHNSVDVPLVTDSKGDAHFVRFRLREFLNELLKQAGEEL
jgi:hypothetical protein